MQSYAIPYTDLVVSRLGYGCMTLGGRWDRNPMTAAEVASAERAVEQALAEGFTLFDHADIYTLGKSELLFGELLRRQPGLRERIVLQSKCGIRFRDDPPGSPPRYDFSYEHIVASVEGILRRLATERLEILLLHRPDPLVEPDEVARAFDALHGAGKVRYFGVSNHTPSQIERLRHALPQPLVVNQLELSLLHPHLINEGVIANQNEGAHVGAAGTLDYCRQHGLLVQAWSPVAGGRLFGAAPEGDGVARATAALVAALAEAKGCSREAIVLGWLLRHPAGIQPIIGTTRPERIAASAQADAVTLSRDEWYALFVAARGGTLP